MTPAALAERRLAACRWLIRIRRTLDSLIDSDLFAIPVLDMLLYLYEAETGGHIVYLQPLAAAAKVSGTNAHLKIGLLIKRGYLSRQRGTRDNRRIEVALTEKGRLALEALFDRVAGQS